MNKLGHEFRTFGGLVGGVWRCAEVLLSDSSHLMSETELPECQQIALRLCLNLRTLQNEENYKAEIEEAQTLLDLAWTEWTQSTQALLRISQNVGHAEIIDILTRVAGVGRPIIVLREYP